MKLVGMNLRMSLKTNKTGELWSNFMSRLNEIPNRANSDKISLQCYPRSYFELFDMRSEFVKWAAVEVNDILDIPKGMEVFNLEAGLYAVFEYKGDAQDQRIFQYIYTEWMPSSIYLLDDRPHFEILGKNYKNNDPDSEEEIWIPIVPK